MTKGNYQIAGTPSSKQPADTSWKSCMCTMIIVLVTILIILLVIPWGPSKHSGAERDYLGVSDKLSGDESDAEMLDGATPTKGETYGRLRVDISTTDKTTTESHKYDKTKLVYREYYIKKVTTEEPVETSTTIPFRISDPEDIEPVFTSAVTYPTDKSTELDYDMSSSTLIYSTTNTVIDSDIYPHDETSTDVTSPDIISNDLTTTDITLNDKTSTDITLTDKTTSDITLIDKTTSNITLIDKKTTSDVTSPDVLITSTDITLTESSDLKPSYITEPDVIFTETYDEEFENVTELTYDSSSPILEPVYTNITCRQFCEKCPEKKFVYDGSCNTPACKSASSKMLSLMSRTKKPCDNFYEYACDGILDDYISETDLEQDVWHRIKRKLNDINEGSLHHLKVFKDQYLSCLNYDPEENGVFEMTAALKTIGKFYDVFTDISTLPLFSHLLTVLLQNNFAAMFDLQVGLNDNENTLGLVITPVIHKSVHETIFRENEKCNDLHENFKNSDVVDLREIYEMYQNCRYNESSSETYLKTIEIAIEKMDPHHTLLSTTIKDDLMTSLKDKFLPTLDLNKPNVTDIKLMLSKSGDKTEMTIGDLKDQISGIEWEYIIETLGFVGCVNSTKVTVHHFDYLKTILNKMARKHCREMHNTILAIYLHEIYRDLVLDQNRINDRKDYCLKFSVHSMKDIASSLYMKSFDEAEVTLENDRYKKLFNELILTLKAEIKTAGWLSSDKPSDAIDKLDSLILYTIEEYIPIIDEILEKQYKEVSLTNEFILNTQKLGKVFRTAMYSKYRGNPKSPENMWSLISNPYSLKVNMLHNQDALVLPFALVHSQKKYKELPGYLTMSDLIFNLAREINLYLLESKFEIHEKEAKREDVNITLERTDDTPEIKIMLDPAQSFEERVLDSAAAKLSYTHYRRTFMLNSTEFERPLPWLDSTGDMLYFLHMAQKFCTKKSILQLYTSIVDGTELHPLMKVNSIVVNSPQFKDAYRCISNITMVGAIHYSVDATDEYPADYDR